MPEIWPKFDHLEVDRFIGIGSDPSHHARILAGIRA